MSAKDVAKSDRVKAAEVEAPETELEEVDFIEPDGEIEPAVDSDDDELVILSPLSDEFDEKVQEAQEQLLHLRHQQELLEKQKAELEELKRKREKFVRGRAEATERLTKATSMLEREIFESQKRLEQFGATRDAFERHLEILDSIDPEDWSRDEMRNELSRALGAIDDAREEYTSEMARVSTMIGKSAPVQIAIAPEPIEVLADEDGDEKNPIAAVAAAQAEKENADATALTPREGRDFIYWLKCGFAFTLPLLVFGIFALILVLMLF